ncbi:MAG: DUF3788 domain-containing protein [Burkholderiales bacterium]|jgi:hypothetical protein|nr:DUF3788 domain-containing protein [Burkholderiales bacterium]
MVAKPVPVSAPSEEAIKALVGARAFAAWQKIVDFVSVHYEMETFWGKGGKAGVHEHKFRKSGKTLCALYVREKSFGFMVVYGKAEREKFEAERQQFSAETQKIFDDAHQYHDGKWLMLEVKNQIFLDDIRKLLLIKKKPNKK